MFCKDFVSPRKGDAVFVLFSTFISVILYLLLVPVIRACYLIKGVHNMAKLYIIRYGTVSKPSERYTLSVCFYVL